MKKKNINVQIIDVDFKTKFLDVMCPFVVSSNKNHSNGIV